MARKSTSQAEPQEANDYQLDPIIDGLLERLPAPGDPWPKADRALWLKILADVFDLIYSDGDDPQPTPEEASGGGRGYHLPA